MLNIKQQISLSQGISAQKYKILLIVRPSKLVDLIKLELSHEGYEIELAYDGMSGLLKCRESKPQLVILDWSISSFSGSDICYRICSGENQTAILVITNGQRISDCVAALDAGADDCIATPFAMSEFLARIRVKFRKHVVHKPKILMFEDLRLNSSTREVYRGEHYIYLTTTEFNLLEYLLAHPRQVLTRTQIIESVWGYDYMGDSNIIEVYVRYLRLKLEKYHGKRLIYTVRSVGYALRESSFNRQ
ncbi:MAG: response regulator transcription factor [Cyanobacteria bacterium P01_A01_bin.40]